MVRHIPKPSVQKSKNGIINLLKNWTLPVAMTVGAVIYLLFASLPALNGISSFFSPIMDAIFPVFMIMILFVTFCKVDFRKLRPVRWHLWVSVFQMLFVAVAMAVIIGYKMTGNSLILMESLLVCIICPGAAAAAVVTQKLGGDIEQMTSYTFISNFLTALLIPVCFPLIDKTGSVSFLAAFLKILYEVCIVLLLPLAMAYIVKHFMHRLHRKIISVKDLSFYIWALSLSIVTGMTTKNIVHADTSIGFLLLIAMLGLVLCIFQFYVGRLIGRRFGTVTECGQALGQKNTAFAIWIAYTYLIPVSSVGPGCYILWQNTINSIEIWKMRKKSKG